MYVPRYLVYFTQNQMARRAYNISTLHNMTRANTQTGRLFKIDRHVYGLARVHMQQLLQ